MTTEATPTAVGSNDQLGGSIRYCYSTNEEDFYGGDFMTREQAIAAAEEALMDQDEPGEKRTVWTGVQEPAVMFLDRMATRMGSHFLEMVDEWLADEIAADDDIVTVADKPAFDAELIALLKKHCQFRHWNAGEIQAHEVAVPGGDQAFDSNAERITREALGDDVTRPINPHATSIDDL